LFSGAGANFGLIVIQRTAGRSARSARPGEHDSTELKRIFSWLGLAPSVANVLGPLAAGLLVDASGYGAAFAMLAALPLGALWWSGRVPREQMPSPAAAKARAAAQPMWRSAIELAGTPGMRRLLLVNWLLSASWDVHAFLVPLLGHGRGLSASAIGAILGVFGLAVSAVRLLIPLLAHRLREAQVLSVSMAIVAAVFAVYPFAGTAWTMALCAAALGLALGAVQPMIMTTLHQLAPAQRQGEAIALRSITINLSSTVMPLAFGVVGATLGAAGLFWVMGALVAAGAWPARRLGGSDESDVSRGDA
jgi:predicted MFS family arabinose efflux permease